MQTLWSRTGLSHRCACRACEQVVGVGRRATTRATRRKATFAEAFTALYSSVLATAAVVDAVRKEDRRAKVDAELEEVRDQLSKLRAQRAVRELCDGVTERREPGDEIEPSDLSDTQNRALWEQWRHIIDGEDFLKDAFSAQGSTEIKVTEFHVKPFGGFRLDSTHVLRNELDRIMRQIEMEECNPNVKQRVFSERIQYEEATDRMRIYIRSLLLAADALQKERSLHNARRVARSHRQGKKEVGTEIESPGLEQATEKDAHPKPLSVTEVLRQSLIADKPNQPKKRTKLLRGGRWVTTWEERLPTLDEAWEAFKAPVDGKWRGENPNQAAATLRLNDELRVIFCKRDLPLDQLLGAVSYRLLMSGCLPDVHTHNLLIAGFINRKLRLQASQAYELFFSNDNKLRSTPSSLALSLAHPAMYWDVHAFKRAAIALVGRDPMIGAKIRRRPLAQTFADPFVSVWGSDYSRRGMAGGWIQEYAPMDQPVRQALISSLLHLRQHVDAASFFLACLQTGASLAADVVFEMFNAIARTPDARSAMRLVRGLSVRWKKFRSLLWSIPEDQRARICRRLDYLMHILNVRDMHSESIDDTISDLGMRRSHLERLHGILGEQGYYYDVLDAEYAPPRTLTLCGGPDVTKAEAEAESMATAMKRANVSDFRRTRKDKAFECYLDQMSPDVTVEEVTEELYAQMHSAIGDTVKRLVMKRIRAKTVEQVQAHMEQFFEDPTRYESGNVKRTAKYAAQTTASRGGGHNTELKLAESAPHDVASGQSEKSRIPVLDAPELKPRGNKNVPKQATEDVPDSEPKRYPTERLTLADAVDVQIRTTLEKHVRAQMQGLGRAKPVEVANERKVTQERENMVGGEGQSPLAAPVQDDAGKVTSSRSSPRIQQSGGSSVWARRDVETWHGEEAWSEQRVEHGS